MQARQAICFASRTKVFGRSLDLDELAEDAPAGDRGEVDCQERAVQDFDHSLPVTALAVVRGEVSEIAPDGAGLAALLPQTGHVRRVRGRQAGRGVFAPDVGEGLI